MNEIGQLLVKFHSSAEEWTGMINGLDSLRSLSLTHTQK